MIRGTVRTVVMGAFAERWPLGRKRALPGIIAPDDPAKIWYLRQTRLFDRLSDAQLKNIAMRSEMRKYSRGEVILGSAPAPDVIYFVKTGRVKVSALSADGKEQILALLEPGDLFGALTADESTELKQVEAFDTSVVCRLPRDLFEDVLRQAPEVAVQVVRILARRLQAAERDVRDLAFRDVPGRVASLLLRLSEEYGSRHERGTRLSFHLTHQDLARMIGSTRETVTTTLNRLLEDGLIAFDHRIVIIINQERLRAIADGGPMSGPPARAATGVTSASPQPRTFA
jgi:CRP/FNR family transcriptional regulator, cyclic AMP receptor protein